MDRCYDGTLVMPSSYAVMDEEEMTYVEGGYISIPIEKRYLIKKNCLDGAAFLLALGAVKRMTKLQLAHEIFAHAMAYYNAKDLKRRGFNNNLIREIIHRGQEIDIDDGGDSIRRQLLYACVWGPGVY